MYISCLVGFIIIFLYCAFVTIKNKEIPNSISQTVYLLSKGKKWIFTLVMFVVAFMVAPQLVESMPNGYEFLGVLISSGILAVGVDPLDKGRKNIIHYAGAVVLGVSSQVAVYMINPYIFSVWIPYIIYTLYMEDGSKNMLIGELAMMLESALSSLL